jgi:hypothetical protein
MFDTLFGAGVGSKKFWISIGESATEITLADGCGLEQVLAGRVPVISCTRDQ